MTLLTLSGKEKTTTRIKRTRTNRAPPLLLLVPALLLILVAYLLPLAALVADSLIVGGRLSVEVYVRMLAQSFYWNALGATFWISGWVTVISLLLGYPLAYYLTFNVKSAFVRRLLLFIIIIPLFTSNIVRSFGWIVLFGRQGVVNKAIVGVGLSETPISILYTETAVIVGLVYIMLPMMTLTIASVLQTIDRRLEEASLDLGANHFGTLFRITIPLSRSGIIAGCLIVFTLTQSAYVIPSVLGGGKLSLMPILIYQQFLATLDFRTGAALSVLLSASTLLVLALAMYSVERRQAESERAS